jgi:hypothetical protein
LLLVMACRIGWLLHSRRAGLITALLLGASPTLGPWIPTALVEPPAIFWSGVWLWALAEGWRAGGRAWWAVAGVALGLGLLTRPTLLYFAPLALAAGMLGGLLQSGSLRDRQWGLATAHVIALVFAAAAILRNAWVFGYPAISTGAGAALFLGSNPMTDGYDASLYFRLAHDVGAVTRGMEHLSIAGDRLLRGVALAALEDRPWPELVAMYMRKLGAFLMVTQAEPDGSLLRAWRIGLLVCAAYGLRHVRMAGLRWLLVALLVYQTLLHAPLLYTHRYSVSAIDLPLSLLAGVGLGEAVARARRLASLVAAVGVAALLGVAFGVVTGPPVLHLDRVPHVVHWQRQFNPPLEVSVGTQTIVDITDAVGLHPWDNPLLELNLSTHDRTHCTGLVLQYRRVGGADNSPPLEWVLESAPREMRAAALVVIGARDPLALHDNGQLHVSAHCASGGRLLLHGVRVAAGRFATY